jgi:hypothetical protein
VFVLKKVQHIAEPKYRYLEEKKNGYSDIIILLTWGGVDWTIVTYSIPAHTQ